MAKWTLEPGHTAAGFCARHMMVTYVRGHFKDVHGTLDYDTESPEKAVVDIEIDVSRLWTGEKDRDAHLLSDDFFSVQNYPKISFHSNKVVLEGANAARVHGDLTIRGVTRPVALEVFFLGEWQTPWWEDGVDKGPKRRAGFFARTSINRHDFGVSWNSALGRGGVVVGAEIQITIDAEAIQD